MTTENANPPVGDTPGASGEGGAGGSGGESGGGKSTVSYESHLKLLDEKKKLKAENDAFKAEKAKREQEELERKGEYQKMLENERKAREDAENQLKTVKEQETARRKLGAVLKGVNGSIDSKFYGLIDIDEVQVDPDTGEIDQLSVTKAVERLKKAYPEIIKTAGGPKLPGEQPGSKSTHPDKISRAKWKDLPSSEMRKWKPEQIVD